jgi:hypothetical protein
VAGSHWSLATSFVDLTNNGHPDIHVANDFGWDVILVNNGNGTFTRQKIPGTNRHGMSSSVRDINGDGYLDIFVTNIEFNQSQDVWEINSGLAVRNRGNTLLINQGNGTFVDRATEYGVREGTWGWASAIEDFDNDGALELVHTTKFYLRFTANDIVGVETTPSLWEETENGSFMARNGTDAGFIPANSRGLVTLDFDRDGDLDMIVSDTNSTFKLYENTTTAGNWLQVRVRNADDTPLGTRVRLVTTNGTRTRVLNSQSDLFSQSTRTLHFGLGGHSIERLEVERPNGRTHVYQNISNNRRAIVASNGSLFYDDSPSVGC